MGKSSFSLVMAGLLSGFLLISSAGYSQVEITPFGGYMFNGKVHFVEGDLKFSDEPDYGISLGVPVRYGVMAELSYIRSESTASWSPSFAYESDYPPVSFNVNINYFQAGVIKNMEVNDMLTGFAGFTLGAAYYNTTQKNLADLWRFAFGIKAGLKYFFTDAVGIRLQGRMLFPIYSGGVGAFCGIGTGGSSCGISFGGSSLILQGDLTAGVVFRLGQ